jgi:signal transduction histidine kinase
MSGRDRAVDHQKPDHAGTFMMSRQTTASLLRRSHRGLLLGAAFTSPQANALTEHYVPAFSDAVFYTFAVTVIGVSAAVIWAYREFRWMVYVGLSSLMLLSVASMDGSLAFLLGGGDFVVWVVPYLTLSATAAVGLYVVSMRLEGPHPLTKLRSAFRMLAALAALLPLSSVVWLGRIPLNIMWIPINFLFLAMLLSQSLPPWTWAISNSVQRRLTRLFPLLVAAFAIIVQLIHFGGSGLSQSALNHLNHITALLYAGSSLAVVVWQVVANTKEKINSERQVLEAERNEARLQFALSQARSDYESALSAASQHRSRLATVSHDLKQPVAALRHAVDQMQRAGNADDARKLARAIDYVASLSRAYIDEGLSEDGADKTADSSSPEDTEVVSSATFAQMLEQMFSQQAAEQGTSLRIVCPDTEVLVAPLETMRIMTNLVSNALAHAEATRILIAFRPRGDHIVFQVHDNGKGIDTSLRDELFEPGRKGEDSAGHGLGLGIVSELCRKNRMPLVFNSRVGHGTSALVSMPRHQARIGARTP